MILLATLILPALPACTPASASPGATPVNPGALPVGVVDSTLIRQLQVNTAPAAPQQILFDWSLQDRDVRVQGRGVLRVQAPYRARLDLFGPQDVELVRAALVGDSLAFVAGTRDVPLPPVAFMWSLLGVFRGPPAAMTGMTGDPSGFTLRYQAGNESWQFRADSASLRFVEWLGGDGGRRTVDLTGPFQGGRPTRAMFRDWREFRELSLQVTMIENTAPFDAGIWNVSIQ